MNKSRESHVKTRPRRVKRWRQDIPWTATVHVCAQLDTNLRYPITELLETIQNILWTLQELWIRNRCSLFEDTFVLDLSHFNDSSQQRVSKFTVCGFVPGIMIRAYYVSQKRKRRKSRKTPRITGDVCQNCFVSLLKSFWNGITKTRLLEYIESFTTKHRKISDKNSNIFHISAQNIDCGYSLEPPRTIYVFEHK